MHITKEHLPFDLKHDLWLCPECQTVNAWNYDDAERAAKKLKQEVVVSHGSCFDNICGNPNCRANIVDPESPILAPCYTHSGD